jgi:hypothetical protein
MCLNWNGMLKLEWHGHTTLKFNKKEEKKKKVKKREKKD